MSETIEHQPFPGGRHRIEADKDIIVWTNRDIPVNPRVLLLNSLGILACLPIAIWLTYILLRELIALSFVIYDPPGVIISALIAVAFWAGTGVALFRFLQRYGTHTIEIDAEKITLSFVSPVMSRTKGIEAEDIWRLSFEKYRHNKDQESRFSVNIFHKRRESIAYWMRAEEMHQLFLLLSTIFQRKGWDTHIQTIEKLTGD